MKKLLSVICILSVLCLLVACGGETEPTKTTEASGEVTTTEATDPTDPDVTTDPDAPTDPTAPVSTGKGGTTASTASGASKTAGTKSTATTKTAATTAKKDTVKKTDVVGSSADPARWIYKREDNGMMVREFTVDSGKGGDPVVIAQFSDFHINTVDSEDLKNPTLAATSQNRLWQANGRTIPTTKTQLAFAKTFADQIVITGDMLDYLTHAGLQFMKTEVWGKYPGIWVTNGNHDYLQVMHNGDLNNLVTPLVQETLTLQQRYDMMQAGWAHDVDYTSKILKNKVMIIQLDNGQRQFSETQIPKLTADLKTARSKGIPVLLFMHIPMYTANAKESRVKALRADDASSATNNNFSRNNAKVFVGDYKMDQNSATAKVYNLIVNNADVVKGVFNGHMHADLYTEIIGKTPSGTEVKIPQYTMTGSCYGDGHMTLITVK